MFKTEVDAGSPHTPSSSISIASTGIFYFEISPTVHILCRPDLVIKERFSLLVYTLIQNDSLCLCAKFLLLWWKPVSTNTFKILFKEAGFLEGSLSGRSGTPFLKTCWTISGIYAISAPVCASLLALEINKRHSRCIWHSLKSLLLRRWNITINYKWCITW